MALAIFLRQKEASRLDIFNLEWEEKLLHPFVSSFAKRFLCVSPEEKSCWWESSFFFPTYSETLLILTLKIWRDVLKDFVLNTPTLTWTSSWMYPQGPRTIQNNFFLSKVSSADIKHDPDPTYSVLKKIAMFLNRLSYRNAAPIRSNNNNDSLNP